MKALQSRSTEPKGFTANITVGDTTGHAQRFCGHALSGGKSTQVSTGFSVVADLCTRFQNIHKQKRIGVHLSFMPLALSTILSI